MIPEEAAREWERIRASAPLPPLFLDSYHLSRFTLPKE